jgi:hypothetical protein
MSLLGLSPISVAQPTSQRTISLRRQVMVFRVTRITCGVDRGDKGVLQNLMSACEAGLGPGGPLRTLGD